MPDTGLRRLPSREFAINTAWCTAAAIAADLIAWLQLLALQGELALADRSGCATACCTPPPDSPTDNAAAGYAYRRRGHGPTRSPPHSAASRPSRPPRAPGPPPPPPATDGPSPRPPDRTIDTEQYAPAGSAQFSRTMIDQG
jgi:hypothetical protein